MTIIGTNLQFFLRSLSFKCANCSTITLFQKGILGSLLPVRITIIKNYGIAYAVSFYRSFYLEYIILMHKIREFYVAKQAEMTMFF